MDSSRLDARLTCLSRYHEGSAHRPRHSLLELEMLKQCRECVEAAAKAIMNVDEILTDWKGKGLQLEAYTLYDTAIKQNKVMDANNLLLS